MTAYRQPHYNECTFGNHEDTINAQCLAQCQTAAVA